MRANLTNSATVGDAVKLPGIGQIFRVVGADRGELLLEGANGRRWRACPSNVIRIPTQCPGDIQAKQ